MILCLLVFVELLWYILYPCLLYLIFCGLVVCCDSLSFDAVFCIFLSLGCVFVNWIRNIVLVVDMILL